MYTDGVSEARDAHGQFLPVPSLAPVLRTGTVGEALDALLDAVRRHVPGGGLTDDLAAILLENVGVTPPPAVDPPGHAERVVGATG
jgi:serine phosphatase RsbU (regulator of sigma subunit)